MAPSVGCPRSREPSRSAICRIDISRLATLVLHPVRGSASIYQGGGKSDLNILRVRCQNAEAFLEHYRDDQPNGGLFCPTTKELERGTPVVVEVVCKALPNRVLIRATVRS